MALDSYELPKTCAKCGTHHGTINHTIKIETTSWWKAILFIVFAIGGKVHLQYKKYTVNVFVCSECKEKLVHTEKINKISAYAGIVTMFAALFGIMGLAAINLDTLINNLIWIALLFIVGVIACGIFPIFNRTKLVSYNGQYFKFTNPQFQVQFAKLNPDLVKQSQSKQARTT